MGATNSPSCSIVGLRKTGAVSRMKSIQNCPGASSCSGGGPRRISRSSKPRASSVPANDSSTMKTTRCPRSRSTAPMPAQLLVGPCAPSGKKTIVAIGVRRRGARRSSCPGRSWRAPRRAARRRSPPRRRTRSRRRARTAMPATTPGASTRPPLGHPARAGEPADDGVELDDEARRQPRGRPRAGRRTSPTTPARTATSAVAIPRSDHLGITLGELSQGLLHGDAAGWAGTLPAHPAQVSRPPQPRRGAPRAPRPCAAGRRSSRSARIRPG